MEEEKDHTNWKAWYWALIIVLLAQIVVFVAISNAFGK